MRRRWQSLSYLPVGLLVFLAGPTVADLPYNPTTILVPPQDDDAIAYIFTPDQSSSQFQLASVSISKKFNPSTENLKPLYPTLPFLSTNSRKSVAPVLGPEGNITVLLGDCAAGAAGSEIWQFLPNRDDDSGNGTWTKLNLSPTAQGNGASPAGGFSYLASSFTFSSTSPSAISFYSFGGMCPSASDQSSSWTSSASYSNAVLEVSPSSSDSKTFSFSTTSTTRAAPVPEAGLTITPLAPTFSNTSDTNPSQNQNFVLLGGHTQSAFINMSQVALFSLPEASWTFLSIDPPTPAPQGDLTRDTNSQDVEPRSGHSALLTPDGTRIILFGGWVGDVNTPAAPQLAILEVGTGYGGSGDWSWTIPSAKPPLPDNAGGIYGHGATMLPGGIMLITGGYSIASSPSSQHRRRQAPQQTPNTKTLLFNTTSLAFVSDYTNPSSSPSSHPSSSSSSSSGALHSTSQKVGLGTGLGLGFSALASLVLIYLWYSRKMRHHRRQRDSEIRELALGTQRYYPHDDIVDSSGRDDEGELGGEGWSEKPRQQNSIKRKPVPNTGYTPWNQLPPNQQRQLQQQRQQQSQMAMTGARDAERTGLLVEIPSPTRGLRRSLYSRPYAYTPGFAQGMHQSTSSAYGLGLGHSGTAGPGGIHPIDEREELEWDAEGKSLRSRKSAKSVAEEDRPAEISRWSDPFKDPPPQILEPAGPATISVPVTVQRPSSPTANVPAQASETDELGRTPSQEKRERSAEIAGWVDDWNAAAATLNWNAVRRSGSVMSQSRSGGNTGANVSRSASHAHSHSAGGDRRSGTMTTTTSSSAPTGSGSGRGSPEKSDRTNSTLSEMSVESERSSLQRSNAGTIRRERSGRSVSAGFVGAAAAMVAGVAGATSGGRRSSVGAGAATRVEIREPPGSAEKRPWEREGLLDRRDTDHTMSMYMTPPESPVKESQSQSQNQNQSASKDRANSLGSRAAGFLGSVKKALVGTGAVRRRVEDYEEKEKDGSWARGSGYWEREHEQSLLQGQQQSAGSAGAPRRATSAGAAFWRGRKGRADWEDDANPDGGDPESPTKSARSEGAARPRLVGASEGGDGDGNGDGGGGEEGDWDVEDAVQQRVVQVMFTVPKEKLRVVNVDPDGLSVVSDGRESRMGREEGEDDGSKDLGKGKGKGKERAAD